MTVESTKTKEIFEGNGATTVFPVPFQYSKRENIHLLFTDAENIDRPVVSNFRIDVSASGDTTVVYPVEGDPIPHGTRLTVFRATPQDQIVDLIYGGAFAPDVLEYDGFDRIVMMVQEINEAMGRAIKVSISDSGEVPSAEGLYAVVRDIAEQAQAAAQQAEEASQRTITAVEQLESMAEAAGDEQVARVQEEGDTQIQLAADQASLACECAADAAEQAEAARHAVSSIPGFADNRHAIFGLAVDGNLQLTVNKYEEGETANLNDYDFWGVLPAEARFTMSGGALILELPFSAPAP